ncbi:hypothetical protein HDU91_003439 [Kappamyces sp. JEL0680]|nr:hypothetical protein HDU91_003439 [Kappamyces sp. JEL0680]
MQNRSVSPDVLLAATTVDGQPLAAPPSSKSPSADKEASVPAKKRAVDEYGFYLDSDDATPLSVPSELEWLKLLGNWKQESTRNRTKALCAQSSTAPAKIFEVIDRDVHRCFPSHSMFSDPDSEGQKNIRMVLQAYALHNPSLGYCQGMGMLVGILLMRMSPEVPLHSSPQDAFWTLAAILDSYIPDYHSVNLYQLRVDAAAFEICFKKFSRQLYKHMKELIPLTYMTQWFLTVYTMAVPWPTVLRVWDMFLHDEYLLKHCPAPSDQLQHILTAPKNIKDPDGFIKKCLSISLGHKQLDRFRSQVRKAHASLDEGINKSTEDTAQV